jgi:hypothetical protein
MAALSNELEQNAENITEAEILVWKLEHEFDQVARFLESMEGKENNE